MARLLRDAWQARPAQQAETRLQTSVADVQVQLERLLAIRETASRIEGLLAAADAPKTREQALDAFTLCLATGDR